MILSAQRAATEPFDEKPEDGPHLRARRILLREIRHYAAKRGLTQVAFGGKFGLRQSRVSELMSKNADQLFKLDTLVDLAAKCGIDVELNPVPAKTADANQGRLAL